MRLSVLEQTLQQQLKQPKEPQQQQMLANVICKYKNNVFLLNQINTFAHMSQCVPTASHSTGIISILNKLLLC